MIATPAAVPALNYPTYVHNCQRLQTCEPSYSAPLPGVPYLQLYVDFGSTKPSSVEFHLVNPCLANATEQIFPSNYVAGQTPEGNWYGVFKYFNSPLTPVTTFVVWLSAMTTGGEKTYFSEMLVVEPCLPLTKIKSCQPAGATTVGFDINGLYYGVPVNVDYLGIAEIRYFHIAYVRQGKVRELSNKGTFKSSLYANFRTTIEKIHQLETELVPKWYKNVLLAIYSRGAIQVNDGQIWLVSELAFESINDDDLTWKPFVQLRETFRLFYGCDDSECVECCSPIVLSATVVTGGDESESESAPAPAIEVFLDGVHTTDPDTLTDQSALIAAMALINVTDFSFQMNPAEINYLISVVLPKITGVDATLDYSISGTAGNPQFSGQDDLGTHWRIYVYNDTPGYLASGTILFVSIPETFNIIDANGDPLIDQDGTNLIWQ